MRSSNNATVIQWTYVIGAQVGQALAELHRDRIRTWPIEFRQELRQRWSEWLPVVCSSEPIDRPSVCQSIKRIYALAHLDEPVIFWCQSPWQAAVMPLALQLLLRSEGLRQKLPQLSQSHNISPLWKQLWAQLHQNLSAWSPRAPGESRSIRSPLLRSLIKSLDTYRTGSCHELNSNLWTYHRGLVAHAALEQALHSVCTRQLSYELLSELRSDFEASFPMLGQVLNTNVTAAVFEATKDNLIEKHLVELVPEQERKRLSKDLWKHTSKAAKGDNSYALEPRYNGADADFGLLARIQDERFGIHHIWWASWSIERLALYEHVLDALGTEALKFPELYASIALSRQASCFAFFEPACFVSDRPARISVDDSGNFQDEPSPVLSFCDGFALERWRNKS